MARLAPKKRIAAYFDDVEGLTETLYSDVDHKTKQRYDLPGVEVDISTPLSMEIYASPGWSTPPEE
jgi:hypothetical protein